MTTKPKAKKFRIRRSGTASQSAASAGDRQSVAQSGVVDSAKQVTAEEAIAGIRREGLTGRQLRMARRVAQKHGLAATSDFDAVRLLRQNGIDPFKKANVLELVVPEDGDPQKAAAQAAAQPVDKPQKVQLPQTVQVQKQTLPATQVASAEQRASEISRIQRDLAKRRRAKLVALWARLGFFVLLPTLLVGWYFYNIATPMYATKSEFVIQTAEGDVGSGLGGLFQGTGLATSQDSVTVQSYLQSREAMLRLDEELGFISHFQNEEIDALQRLDEDSTNEQAYNTFQKNVKIGYDPTEGIIKMEVIAADPEVSAAYSTALVGYAEEQVDNLTDRVRKAQLDVARKSLTQAELRRNEAQAKLLELQRNTETFDPASENAAISGQINQLETRLIDKRLELATLQANSRPNQARVTAVNAEIGRLQEIIEELRAQLTTTTNGESSLAEKSAEIALAQADLETRNIMLQQSMATFETAQLEATKQVRYLSLGVAPVAPDEPTYPRTFENTALAFLIFSGIYLMISLTASILREQVSS